MSEPSRERETVPDIVRIASKLIIKPERPQRLPLEIENELHRKYGIEPRRKQRIDGNVVIFSSESTSPEIKRLVEASLFTARPALPEETDGEFVYCRPTQGRTTPLQTEGVNEGKDYFPYADVKGNSFGGNWRLHMSRVIHFPGTATFIHDTGASPWDQSDGRNAMKYGLLNDVEFNGALRAMQGNQGKHEKIVGFVMPRTLPDSKGVLQETNIVLKELFGDPAGFSPLFCIRLWHDPATLADFFYTVNPDQELQFTLNRLLLNPIHTGITDSKDDLWDSFPYEYDEEGSKHSDLIKGFVTAVKANTEPYIVAMREQLAKELGDTPTNQELFNSFYRNNLHNYRELIRRDAVNGALHTQNIRINGEWGDSVTETNIRTEQFERKERISDFYNVYYATVLMGLVYDVDNLPSLEEFYAQATSNVEALNHTHFPNRFGRFVHQTVLTENDDLDSVRKDKEIRERLDSNNHLFRLCRDQLEELYRLFSITVTPMSDNQFNFF